MSYKQDIGVCEDVYNSLPVGTPGVASAATATQSCLECKFYWKHLFDETVWFALTFS